MPALWTNSPKGLYNQFCEEYANKQFFEKSSLDIVRRTLNKLVDKGILIKNPNIENTSTEFRYYPNESYDGYVNLIWYVFEDYRGNIYPCGELGLDPIYSQYSKRMLNRQFVLDCLRKNIQYIRIESETGFLDIPLLGHYPKNYDVCDDIQAYIDSLHDVEKILKDKRVKSYRRIEELFFDGAEKIVPDDRSGITSEKRESNLLFINKLISGLTTELEYLKNVKDRVDSSDPKINAMKNFSDFNWENYHEHMKNLIPENYIRKEKELFGFNWYRDEAVWREITLSDSERNILDNLRNNISEGYPEFIDDNIVMPILCLIQLSPSALFYFTSTDSWKKSDKVYSLSVRDQRLSVFEIPTDIEENVKQFLVSNKSFNELLGALTRHATIDYLFKNCRIGSKRDFHDTVNMTRLSSFGLSRLQQREDKKPADVPSLFLFNICKGYTVSIYYSECLEHHVLDRVLTPVADKAVMLPYDWTPAMGNAYRDSYFPSIRLYEITNMIMNSVNIVDSEIDLILEQAILRGMI